MGWCGWWRVLPMQMGPSASLPFPAGVGGLRWRILKCALAGGHIGLALAHFALVGCDFVPREEVPPPVGRRAASALGLALTGPLVVLLGEDLFQVALGHPAAEDGVRIDVCLPLKRVQ